MTEQIKLTKADRKRVWWRSQFLQGSWNYERMQNMGWAYALIPALKKLYTTKEDRAAALERHMEFFNTHPYVAAPIIGVTLALEEERANGTAIDNAAIQGVKIGMMGPLAGIGDPVFWFTVRPILGALGASLAQTGNLVDYSFSSLAGTLSVWPSCGTLKNLATRLDLKSPKTCQVVSYKTSLRELLSLVCLSLLSLYNAGYLSTLPSTFQASSFLKVPMLSSLREPLKVLS